MSAIILVISVVATALLTIEGAWILYTTRTSRNANAIMTTPSPGRKKKICIIFPTYKDKVDLDRWLEWSKGETNVKYIIAEDGGNSNAQYADSAELIHRTSRSGFKAGALNNVLDLLTAREEEFDYIMVFDSDHIPYNQSIKDIYGFLNKEVIQFFWLDGLPLSGPLNWLTFSSRYYSNWNIYNRSFPNLTGSAIAIRYDLIKEDGLRFPETITEDYALTLLTISHRKLKVTVIPFALSIGSSPKSFKVFVKQQTRWAEGTIRDAKKYFTRIMFSNPYGISSKIDFMFHVNLYLQGIWMLITLLVVAFFGITLSIYFIPIILFQAIAYIKTLSVAPKKYWPIYFFMNYCMAVVQIYAFLRAIFVKNGTFVVTEKTYDPTRPAAKLNG